ncbi:hypothetical protein H6B07_20220, partial [Mediterraneibacter glycyrrhizinilyticus]|nr:hypothetical protein [Mediterraneibacter glycyrrhizinilyticus]
VPGTGIAFLMPLSSVGGKKVLQFLIDGQKVEKVEESVMKNTNELFLKLLSLDFLQSQSGGIRHREREYDSSRFALKPRMVH